MKIIDIFNFLNDLFPVADALEFDNVGLLIGDPDKTVKNCLVSLDCNLETLENAKKNGCELIITHHPVIFEPMKKIIAGSIHYELIKNDIAVISMHTNLDIGNGGVNDKLCNTLGLAQISPVNASDGYLLKSGVVSPITARNLAKRIKESLGGFVKFVDGGKEIQKVLVCSGSGGGYIEDAIDLKFDALITADIKHHHFLIAHDNNVSLFDAGHFNTEDIIVDDLTEMLKNHFKGIQFNAFHSESIKFA